jgi:hypothetical protein
VIETTVSTGRCPIRDEGHRCKKHIGHEPPCRAFGQEWVGSVVIAKTQAERKPRLTSRGRNYILAATPDADV